MRVGFLCICDEDRCFCGRESAGEAVENAGILCKYHDFHTGVLSFLWEFGKNHKTLLTRGLVSVIIVGYKSRVMHLCSGI